MWESERGAGAERSGNAVMNGRVCQGGSSTHRGPLFVSTELAAVTAVHVSVTDTFGDL